MGPALSASQTAALTSLKYWKFAIWKFYLGTLITAGGVVTPIVVAWDKMTTTERGLACFGAFMAVMKSWDLFFDQTVARLAAGKTIVPIGANGGHDTEILRRIEVAKSQVETIKPGG